MNSRVSGLFHRVAWSIVIGLATSILAVLPYEGRWWLELGVRTAWVLDFPISVVGLALPMNWRGAWLHFFPIGMCRGIAPDIARWTLNQVLIAIPVYTSIFYLPNVVRSWWLHRSRVAA